MVFRIIKNKNGYFVENIKTGHKFSKKPLTEKNAKKQFNILNRYLRTLEGSGLNRGEIKELKTEPLSDTEIREHLPNVKIVSHQDFKNYKTIEELLPNNNDVVIVIWEAKPNYGHWTILSRYICEETKKPTIEYFDSYGYKINEPLKWINKKYIHTIDNNPYLDNLLKNASKHFDIVYSSKVFQEKNNENIATCGRHCISRAKSIINHNQSLSNYIKMMNSIKDLTGFNFDEIITELIN
jgi:hypothetical protein